MVYNFDQPIDRRGSHSIKWECGDLLRAVGLTDRFDDETIPLFVADMDFPCPEPVVQALRERVDKTIFGYSLHWSDPEYVNAIRHWFSRRHQWEIEEDSIVYCPGTVEAIVNLIRTFTDIGDGVIIQPPVYSPFRNSILANHRQVINNPLVNTNGDGFYEIDFEDFERKAADPRNKLFLLCSPHNPVGRVWNETELRTLAELCAKHGIILVADEIHGDLVRKDVQFQAIRTLVDDEQIIVCTAINKTFNTAGLHCSNIIIDNGIMRDAFKKEMGMRLPSPFSISALIAAYTEGEDWLNQVNDYIDGNLDFLGRFLSDYMPKVKYRIPEGTYIAWMDFSGYDLPDREIHHRIYRKANVVLEDGERFGDGGQGFQRICVPSPRSLIRTAMERIRTQFRDLE